MARVCLHRIYRLCLHIYPRSFRAQFADEMARVFVDQLEATTTRGYSEVLAVCARELSGLLRQGLRERVYALQSRPVGVAQTAGGPGLLTGAARRKGFVRFFAAAAVLAGLGVLLFFYGVQWAWQFDENTPSVNDAALADLNGDGYLDAFIAVGHGNMPFPAYALYNDGAGRLGEQAQAVGKWVGYTAALGDLNSDGRADALLDITGGGLVVHYKHPALAVFRAYESLSMPGPIGVMRLRPVLGDLNGDGRLDVFAAGCCGRPPGESPDTVANAYQPPYSRVWLQTPEGRLAVGQRVGEAPSHAAALADVDGDGDLDVFLANGRELVSFVTPADREGPPQPNTIWFNDGRGNFTDSGQQVGQAESTAVALGDLNGDGFADAVVGNRGPDEVWFNDGEGFFTDSGQRLGTGLSEYVFLADLDGDSDLDLLAAGETQARTWFNDGHGQFQVGRQRIGYGANDAVAVGDLTGDGHADVLVAGVETSRVWGNDGRGRFTAGPSIRYK